MDVRSSEPESWLERYRAGDRAIVWHEIRQLGARLDGAQREGAQLVCDEMARRARRNVEVLVEQLNAEGYRFHSNDDRQEPEVPFLPASGDAEGQARWLVEHFGSVPMTLLAWLRIVGDVWLVGTHPEWPEATAADPLVIDLEGLRYPTDPLREYFASDYDLWLQAQAESDDDRDLFCLPMSPDRLTKDNTSGGPPYGVVVPDGCVDGLWAGETTMPFVAYLNKVFANGGFPGQVDSYDAWQHRSRLAAPLLPL
ncbi:hypothetical protein OG809_24110 [Kribbella soli]